jgi:hypothetical protein
MPFKAYDPNTKAAFLKAAADARAANKPWADVHSAAKAAGYTGTVKGITRMVEKADPKAKATKSSGKKVLTPKPVAKSTKAKKAPAKKANASKPTAKRSPTPKVVTGGPGKRYTAAMKSAIMSAAIAARGAGKKWTEALRAAVEKGYRGSLQGIVKMIRASNRKKHSKPAAKVGRPKGKIGRPKGSGKRLGRPSMKAIAVNGFGSIQAAVDRIVKERVRGALDRAIAALKAI